MTKPRGTAFDTVRAIGCELPGVVATSKYDGSPVLKVDGMFMAGLAMHPSAETETLVIRAAFEDRVGLLEDAPETYYLTDYYRRHPVVLVRLGRVEPGALHDLLSMSWRLTKAKVRKREGARVSGWERGGRHQVEEGVRIHVERADPVHPQQTIDRRTIP